VGLFLSEDPLLGDPLTPLSLHRYLYAYQNPLVYIDLNGAEGRPFYERFYSDVIDEAVTFYRRQIESPRVLRLGAGRFSAAAASFLDVAEGVLKTPVVLGEEIGQFAATRELEDLPVLGSVGQELGESAAALYENPTFETGLRFTGAASGATLTVLGGVSATRGVGRSYRSRLGDADSSPHQFVTEASDTAGTKLVRNSSTKVPNRIVTDVGTRSVDDVNAPFIKKGWNPPYSGKLVREFTAGQDTVFVRVHGSGNKARSWMMRPDEVKGLTPAHIKDKFALPELPSHVSEVHVPSGTRIRVGKVAPQEGWGVGGAWQYELLERLPEELFRNTRPLQ
jgi:hypothetical protein